MKNSTTNIITLVVLCIVTLVLTNFKVDAGIKTKELTDNAFILNKNYFNTTAEIVELGFDGSETAVTAPTAQAATKITGNSFQANWSAVKDVDGYKLYVYTQGARFPFTKTYVSGFNPKAVTGAKTIKYNVSGLNSSTTYYFALTAVTVAGKTTVDSDLSNVISVTTTAPTTYVPDDNFEAYLEANGMGNDITNDNYVFTDRINTLTSLTLNGKSIADLTGIKDFTALTYLDCANNQLTSLDVSPHTALTYLICGGNQLSTLDVSLNTALKHLGCYANQLSTLDVSLNTALTALQCHNNQLTTLNVSANTSLMWLLCFNNHLTTLNLKNGNNYNMTGSSNSIGMNATNNPNLSCIEVDDPAFAATYSDWEKDATARYSQDCNAPTTYVPDDNFEQALITKGHDDVLDDYVLTANINTLTSLDVYNKSIADLTGIEDFTALTELDCERNQLESLDLSKNTALKYLSCEDNELTSLDVSQNIALVELECFENKLTSLDVSQNIALVELECFENKLESLDVSQNIALVYLDCEDNKLTSLDVSQNNALTYLDCAENELSSLNVKNGNNKNFTYFEAMSNPNLSCIEVDDAAWSITNWTDIDAASRFSKDCNAPTTYVPDDNFEQALITKGFDDVLDDYVVTANVNAITSLNVNSYGIADLTGIEAFTALTSLMCSFNDFTALNVSSNTALTHLHCSYNDLNTLDVGANTDLAVLFCNNMKLSALDVRANAELAYLSCGNNDIENLDVSANTALTYLACYNNKLTSLNLKNGNNSNMTNAGDNAGMFADDNPNLSCIEVDDPALAVTYPDWEKDATASYSENCDALAAPENLETTQIVDNSFVAKWGLVSGASEYGLSVYTKNAAGDKVYLDDYNPAIRGATTQKALVEGLNPNTAYYWYVQAANSSQTSEESATQTVKTKYTGTSILEVTDITSTSCLASWSPVAGALEYKLWVLNESDEYIDGFGPKSVSETSFLIEGLSPNGDYYIAVSVVYIGGESAKSSNWKITTSRYTLALSASPEVGGAVSVHNDVDNPDNTIARAVANDGYVFVNWTESGVEVSTNASYSFPLDEDRTLVANFAASITTNTLSLSATPAEGGTVTGAETINTGSSVTAEATANAGYEFVNWTEGVTEVSTNASYTFTLNEDKTLVANFTALVTTNTLSLSATPAEGGTVTGAETVNTGSSVTAQATANEGYAFVNWTESGTEVSTETSYTFALNTNGNLVANFRLTTAVNDKGIAQIKVWPNPTTSIIYLSEIPFGSSIKVTSLLGQVIIHKNNCKNMETLNIESFKNGIYLLIIENGEKRFTQKIIKR